MTWRHPSPGLHAGPGAASQGPRPGTLSSFARALVPQRALGRGSNARCSSLLPAAAARHVFRDHSRRSYGSSSPLHRGPAQKPREADPGPGARPCTDARALHAASKLAYWSGLAYLPYDTLAATLAEEGLTLVAYGRTDFTCWYVADGSIDYTPLQRRPGPTRHHHHLQRQEAHATGAETRETGAAGTVTQGDSEEGGWGAAAASPGLATAGGAEAAKTGRGDPVRGTAGAGSSTGAGGAAVPGGADQAAVRSAGSGAIPIVSNASASTPMAAGSDSSIHSSSSSSSTGGSADSNARGPWAGQGPGHGQRPTPDRPMGHLRDGHLHLRRLPEPKLHLHHHPHNHHQHGHEDQLHHVGHGAAPAGALGALEERDGEEQEDGPLPRLPPHTRCRFIFLRGVQWSAPETKTLSLWSSLASCWPVPLLEATDPGPAAAAAAATAAATATAAIRTPHSGKGPAGTAGVPSPADGGGGAGWGAGWGAGGRQGGAGGAGGGEPGAGVGCGEGDELVVHAGVAAMVRQLLPELLPYIRDAGGAAHVAFAGHSLGGALAKALWATALLRGHRAPGSASCHTFGSPAVLAHARGGGGARVLAALRAPASACANYTLQHDPVPRAMLSVDPGWLAAQRLLPGAGTLLALRGLLAGEGAALGPSRFLYESVGTAVLLRWGAQGGCEAVALSEEAAAAELQLALDALLSAPVRSLQLWLDHHHASYHQDLEAASRGAARRGAAGREAGHKQAQP